MLGGPSPHSAQAWFHNLNSFLSLHSGSSSVDAVGVSSPCWFFLSPWMFDKSPFRSVLDFFVGWVADEGDVCKLGTLWVCCRPCILSTRCSFTSSFHVVKLSLKQVRRVAVFNTSCRFLFSYLCFRSSPIFCFSWRSKLLLVSSIVNVEYIFQVKGRTEDRVVCFSPLRTSAKELNGLSTSLTVSRMVMSESLGKRWIGWQ